MINAKLILFIISLLLATPAFAYDSVTFCNNGDDTLVVAKSYGFTGAFSLNIFGQGQKRFKGWYDIEPRRCMDVSEERWDEGNQWWTLYFVVLTRSRETGELRQASYPKIQDVLDEIAYGGGASGGGGISGYNSTYEYCLPSKAFDMHLKEGDWEDLLNHSCSLYPDAQRYSLNVVVVKSIDTDHTFHFK